MFPMRRVQVVDGAGEVWMLRFAGIVSVKTACVSAKPFVLRKVIVSVEATFTPTLAGENASETVGGAGATAIGVGHAEAAVPADEGALMVAAP